METRNRYQNLPSGDITDLVMDTVRTVVNDMDFVIDNILTLGRAGRETTGRRTMTYTKMGRVGEVLGHAILGAGAGLVVYTIVS